MSPVPRLNQARRLPTATCRSCLPHGALAACPPRGTPCTAVTTHRAPGHEATRYLARHHEKLARKHGNNFFVLLLKVVNSQAYGPDVVELVGDVTRAATSPLPTPAPASRTSPRA
ncbi:hypothetical protein GCM10023257_04070 [Streptomyces hyderabadensis]|uniref:Uncharacterized protein n=1 Tax=Streptomyces hyderabadensis TaxID=598549 RepID=A0ABP9HIH3_9ACTN